MQRVFVAGGAGFIGSNFIRHVLNRYADVEVVNFDALTYAGNPENLSDVVDDRRYAFVARRRRMVFHFPALTGKMMASGCIVSA